MSEDKTKQMLEYLKLKKDLENTVEKEILKEISERILKDVE